MITLSELGHETPLMVFDVESMGLHGQSFAAGYVVIQNGVEVEEGMYACPRDLASPASEDDRRWVIDNIPELESNCDSRNNVIRRFWEKWVDWNAKGALLAADCGWPVEANFLTACVWTDLKCNSTRGPYPLIEISTMMLAAGMDPMITYPRLENEKPKHNPLTDARQSARLLMEALNTLNRKRTSHRF